MTKVKLTQEQAERMDYYKGQGMNLLFYDINEKDGHILGRLTDEQIARAWLEGYEVEPQFKEGDIVVTPSGIMELRKIGEYVAIPHGNIRHATDNEKIFYELGREICEFKEGDKYVTKTGSNRSVENSNNLKVVECAYEQNNIKYFYPIESRKEFK